MKHNFILSFVALIILATSPVVWAYSQAEISNSTDESVLIDVIQHDKNPWSVTVACKRLAVYGTAKSVPALSTLLADEKFSHEAQTALLEMTCPESDEALIQGVQNLDGKRCLGCVTALKFKKNPKAVPVLIDKLGKSTDAQIRAEIYLALSSIGTEDAKTYLISTLNKLDSDSEARQKQGLALIKVAMSYVSENQTEKAISICDAIVKADFPVYIQNEALYHAILIRNPTDALELLKANLTNRDGTVTKSRVDVALKTIREFPTEYSQVIVSGLIEALPKIKDVQDKVLLALAERQDEASQDLIIPFLIRCGRDASTPNLVAIRGLGCAIPKYHQQALEALLQITDDGTTDSLSQLATRNSQLLSEVVNAIARLNSDSVNKAIVDQFHKKNSEFTTVVLIQVIEQKRLFEMVADLQAMVAKAEKSRDIRVACLKALGELVTMDQLPSLISVLATESDDELSSKILSSACTRLPQEECAATIVKVLGSATQDEQFKTFRLLKLIGGQTALNYIEQACNSPDSIDVATQILGKWDSQQDIQQVAEICLKVAKESKEKKYAVRAIRAYIRLIRQFWMPSNERFTMCRTAFETATRPEDKVLIFEVFKRVIELESAKQAFSYSSDPAFAEPAYEAVVTIASKFQGDSPELAQLLQTIVEKSKVESTVNLAKEQINRVSTSQQEASVKILSAKYGIGDKIIDVTDKVLSHFTGKRGLKLGDYNLLFGDVAPGQVKTLTVEIELKSTGEKRTLTFQENEMILLP